MNVLETMLLLTIVVVLIFGSVIFFGAPFLPTLRSHTIQALDLLDLKAGQTLLELGSGDGRVMREAARRGIRVIGYELNPLLVIYSRVLNLRFKKLTSVKWANYWLHPLPKCDGIYAFLLVPYMAKLDKKITSQAQIPVKLVSFAFKIPGKKPIKKSAGLLLYLYE